MVAGLLGSELADGGEDTEGVACQHDDVRRLAIDNTGDLRIGDVLDGVRAARVFRNADVIVIRDAASGIVHDVLEDAAVADGAKDIGLLLGGEVDALGVASTLDVEHTGVGPDVLVVSNEVTFGIGGKGGLSSSGETEKQGNIALFDTDIGGRVQGELTKFDRLQVVLQRRSNVSKKKNSRVLGKSYHD